MVTVGYVTDWLFLQSSKDPIFVVVKDICWSPITTSSSFREKERERKEREREREREDGGGRREGGRRERGGGREEDGERRRERGGDRGGGRGRLISDFTVTMSTSCLHYTDMLRNQSIILQPMTCTHNGVDTCTVITKVITRIM